MTWGMRIAGAGMAFFTVAGAHAQSGEDMLRARRLFERGMHREGRMVFVPPDPTPGRACIAGRR